VHDQHCDAAGDAPGRHQYAREPREGDPTGDDRSRHRERGRQLAPHIPGTGDGAVGYRARAVQGRQYAATTAAPGAERGRRDGACYTYACRLGALAMAFDHSRISFTAKIVAYYRQFTDIPFAEETARRIGADEAFTELVRAHGLDPAMLRFYAIAFEARYKSIGRLLREAATTQVLELASGFSLRGLDLAQRGFRYVEMDLAGVVAEKRLLLNEVRGTHGLSATPAHVLLAGDALDATQVRNAADALDPSRPVTILCEGLVQYLTADERERLVANIRDVLARFQASSWITPDFAFQGDTRGVPAERLRLREAVLAVTQRQLDAAAFADEVDLATFLGRLGLRSTMRLQIDETPELSCVARLGLPPQMAEQLRPRLRVWTITPVGHHARACPEGSFA
jgi:O-methyltransferase involved in polyketide biosynthesis